MNGNDLLNAMENVDDKHILASEKLPKKRRLLIPALSAAAAAIIAVTAGGIAYSNKPPKFDENLPKLEATLAFGGMGFEGYQSLEQAENGNPWREDRKLKTLPVYHSDAVDPDPYHMRELLKSAAEAIGEDFQAMKINDHTLTEEKKAEFIEGFKSKGAPDEEIQSFLYYFASQSSITASTDNMYMTVSPDYSISIHYSDGYGIKIPDEYLAAAPEKDKLERMAEYVFENYGEMIDIKDPVRKPSPYLNIDGHIEFCEGGNTKEEELYGYNFKRVRMSFDMNENTLNIMYINTDDGLEKLGDYPLISVKEAKKLLFDGNYLSSRIDYTPSGTEPIGKVELMYLSGRGYEFAMPYYRFLVGVDDGGNLTYTAYYVPAVRGEYLTEMPTNLIFNGGVVDKYK